MSDLFCGVALLVVLVAMFGGFVWTDNRETKKNIVKLFIFAIIMYCVGYFLG